MSNPPVPFVVAKLKGFPGKRAKRPPPSLQSCRSVLSRPSGCTNTRKRNGGAPRLNCTFLACFPLSMLLVSVPIAVLLRCGETRANSCGPRA